MDQRNYHEKILLAGSATCITGFLFFSIHLLNNHEYLLALLDLALTSLIASLTIYAWRSRKTDFPAIALTIICLSSAVSIAHAYGPKMIFWLYPATLLGFSLLDVRLAATLNSVAMLLTLPSLYPRLPPIEISIIYGSIVTLSLFGFIFSSLTAQQREQLTKLASSDQLTGAWNRRALDANLTQNLNNLNHYKSHTSTSVLMLDLDHFKRINDTFGHSAGDKVLHQVAHLIRSKVRATEQLYRYGGEEFVVVVDNANLKRAYSIAEKIRHEVEQTYFQGVGHITVSIGVTELVPGHTLKHLLDEADQSLYKAKRQGRNCVSCHKIGNQSSLKLSPARML